MAKKILAVDDEKPIARLVQVNLERAGFQVVVAVDGIDALEKVKTERPDMIVSDVMMPRMDGFELLRTLKADAATRDIPVIMLTAKSQDKDVMTGWTSGAEMYLTKPFNPMELVTVVRRIFSAQLTADDEARITV